MPVVRQDHQFIADNIDHNIATIDGSGTFHMMGIVAAVTPRTHRPRRQIRKAQMSVDDIVNMATINITPFTLSIQECNPLVYNPKQFADIFAQDELANLDVLWKSSLLGRYSRPNWSGFMQVCTQNGSVAGLSSG